MTLADHAITAEQVKLLIREGEGLAVELKERYTSRIDEDIVAFLRDNAQSMYHPVGTCRMGPSAADGAVVDARLRVHGVAGLRVVDASVMPVVPSGNTSAPAVMVAEKAADMIREDARAGRGTYPANARAAVTAA
jgi:choline dehydrogenase